MVDGVRRGVRFCTLVCPPGIGADAKKTMMQSSQPQLPRRMLTTVTSGSSIKSTIRPQLWQHAVREIRASAGSLRSTQGRSVPALTTSVLQRGLPVVGGPADLLSRANPLPQLTRHGSAGLAGHEGGRMNADTPRHARSADAHQARSCWERSQDHVPSLVDRGEARYCASKLLCLM